MEEAVKTLRDDIRAKYPGLAKAGAAGQRLPAITLACCECMGGSLREAKTCETRDCFLWPVGPAGRAQRKAG